MRLKKPMKTGGLKNMPTGDIQQKTLRDLKKKLRDSFFRKKQQHDLYKFWGLCFFFGKSVTKLFFFFWGGGMIVILVAQDVC